jgi:hypothetical protein
MCKRLHVKYFCGHIGEFLYMIRCDPYEINEQHRKAAAEDGFPLNNIMMRANETRCRDNMGIAYRLTSSRVCSKCAIGWEV